MAKVERLLRTEARGLRKTAEDARSIRSCRVDTPTAAKGTRSIFDLQLLPPGDAVVDIAVQLGASEVYQSPGSISYEDLQHSNKELREENGDLRENPIPLA